MHKYYVSLFEDIQRQRQEARKKASPQERVDNDSVISSLQELGVENDFSENSENTEEVDQPIQEELPSNIFFKYDYSKIKTP